MLKQITTTLCMLLIGFSATSHAATPPAPKLSANAYLLIDFASGNTIAAHQADEKLEPASLTKIMTAYLTFEAVKNKSLSLDQVVPVSQRAWKMEGSRMFIQPDKKVTVDALLHGLIIQSGNDAAVALAEAVAGSEAAFAELMNEKAKALGLANTHYHNATGLPHEMHYTTASDLATLTSALIRDFPKQYARLYRIKTYTYNNITQNNRNRLLWLDPHVDGVKTGHTESAGYCLIASAKRKESRLISVVLGTKSKAARTAESQKLLNYGFQFYDTHLVFKPSESVETVPVWKGASKTVQATVKTPLYFTLPKGEYAKLKATMSTQQPLVAPLKAGQVIGTITFKLGDKIVRQAPLVAAESVAEGNFFNRMIDTIQLMIQ